MPRQPSPAITIIFVVTLSTLLTLTFQFSSAQTQYSSSSSFPTAGTCRMQTSCRTPNLTSYNYTGIARSGYLKVDQTNGSALAFMFFGKKEAAFQQLKNWPTVIVLGGGPGNSSMWSNLREVGPLRINKVFSPVIENNRWTWNNQANLLFIQQPIGTGMSCMSDARYIPSTVQQAATDFYRGLYQLYSEEVSGCFNSKNLNIPPSSPLFLYGQGYAGKFASAFGSKLVQEQRSGKMITGFKGLILGGPLNAPWRTMTQIGNFGFSLGLLDYQERMRMQKLLLKANIERSNQEWSKVTSGYQRVLSYLYQRSGVNYFDITKDELAEDLVQNFFAIKKNIQSFGFQAGLITFESHSKAVFQKQAPTFMQPQTTSLSFLLNLRYPVLIYQGQDDAYANPTGTIRWIEQLDYQSIQQFRSKGLSPWKINGVMMGSIKSVNKLTYMVVNNAGHYVPQDNAEAAYYMFRDWIKANK